MTYFHHLTRPRVQCNQTFTLAPMTRFPLAFSAGKPCLLRVVEPAVGEKRLARDDDGVETVVMYRLRIGPVR